MPDINQPLAVNSVIDKFSALICLWVITELTAADITSWTENGSASGYVTFDPESFSFFHRKVGDELTKNECVMGVQEIDLHGLRDVALSSLPHGTTNHAQAFQVVFRELYIGEVLRYWMFAAGTNDLLTAALLSVDAECAAQCVRNIEVAFDTLVNGARQGSLVEMVLKMRGQVISDEYHDLGINFLH